MIKFIKIAEELGKSGLCVWPNFFTSAMLRKLRADLTRIQEAQGFHRAGTGQGIGKEVRDLVRRDDVHWLERLPETPTSLLLWSQLDRLQQALNRTLYLGLSTFEGHYAVYPPGGFYRRHLDTFRQDPGRVVSLVLYLNEDWKPADGGQLRVYGAGKHIDIDPVGGTLVCFLSRESEHEVLLSSASRLSFTGWFKQS